MKKIEQRLMQIDLDQLIALSNKSRQILISTYRRRKLPLPSWLAESIKSERRLRQ